MEYGDTMSDAEMSEMGIRLLQLHRLFSVPKSEEQIKVSDQEFNALKYLHQAKYAVTVGRL